MTALSDVDASVSGEFAQYDYQSVFNAFNGEGNGGQNYEDCRQGSTFWELLLTSYLPVIFLWIRRGMFGITMIVRTLILGHLLRLLCGNVSDWVSDKTPSWLPSFLVPILSGAQNNAKIGDNSWPPPALTGLALLTVFALVVHPDGFTWIMLRKARDAILSVFAAMSSCWQLLVTDYGVIPTIIASATLASIILLLFVMLRTITPKRSSRRRHSPTPKKKKKRKGQARQRGNPVKSKHSASATTTSASTPMETSQSSKSGPPDSEAIVESSSSGEESTSMETTLKKEAPTAEAIESNNGTTEPGTSATEDRTSIASPVNHDVKPVSKDDDPRNRVASVSTLETTPLSDDHSCSSTSIRSYPSESVASSKSNSVAPVNEESVFQDPSPSTSNSKNDSTPSKKSRRKQRPAGNEKQRSNVSKQSHKSVSAQKSTRQSRGNNSDGRSRWDALRPQAKLINGQQVERTNQHSENNNRQAHKNSTANVQREPGRRGGRGQSSSSQQQQHQRRGNNQNRSNSSPTRKEHRAPRNGNRQPKISRNAKNHTGRRNNNSTVSRSPQALAHQDHGLRVPAGAPSLPVPPPGLTRISADAPSFVPESGLLLGTPKANQNDSKLPLLSAVSTGANQASGAWETSNAGNQAYVSASFFQQNSNGWNQSTAFESPPRNFVSSAQFSTSSRENNNHGFGGNRKVKENPFAPEPSNDNATGNSKSGGNKNNREFDRQIEADLQELGGQMAVSILDF